jgi:hypothetical protein
MTYPNIPEYQLTLTITMGLRCRYGNPAQQLCDYWNPMLTFNEDELAMMIAPAGIVKLVKEPGLFPGFVNTL